jgi:hypothetical protein
MFEGGKMAAREQQPSGAPMTLGNTMNSENYRHLAAQEATLATAAVSNASTAHYAMAAYYTRLGGERSCTDSSSECLHLRSARLQRWFRIFN